MTTQIPSTTVIDAISSAWGIDLVPVGCSHCQKTYLLPSNRVGQFCPNCAAGPLTPQPVRTRPEPPELALPFQQTRESIRPTLEHFVNDLWLRPADFNLEAILGRIVPVYLPVWLVDSTVKGIWQAEAGFNYQVKSARETYQSGEWRSKEVVETRSNWETRTGTVERSYQNISTPALRNHASLFAELGGMDFHKSQVYRPEQILQAALQVPDVTPEEAWPVARTAFERAAEEECRTAASADHIRNFRIDAGYSNLNWTQLLIPVYASYYSDDDGRPHTLLINGQTGKVSGVRIASQRKGWRMAAIAASAAVAIFILSLVCFSLAVIFPPASALGVLGVIAALALGIFAIVPAVYPWQWNRKVQDPKVIATS
jgi:hypothetical protein